MNKKSFWDVLLKMIVAAMYGLWPILTTSSLTLVRVWRCNAWVTARSKGGLVRGKKKGSQAGAFTI